METSKIGEKILKKRKEKNITQEQLANIIGISAGAVCKWETGNSTPDITLLAPLARALGTTIDDLLSFEPELSEEDVLNLKQELNHIFMMSGYEAGETKSKKLLNEYPNCIYLKLTVAVLLQLYAMMQHDNNEEIFRTRLESALDLLDIVVANKEIKYVSSALFSIATIHMMLKNYDESEKIIKKLIESYVDPMILYPQLLEEQGKKEEAKILCEQILLSKLTHCTTLLSIMSRLSLDEGNSEQAFTFIETIQKIQDIFNFEFSSGYYICRYYIRMNQLELGAKAFLTYVKGVVSDDYDNKNNLYFKDIKLENDPAVQEAARNTMYSSFFHNPEFKPLEGMKDYEEALELLENKLNES